jgi:hypothetical protein
MSGPSDEVQAATHLDRVVDLASHDSFPASDPPPWWSGPREDVRAASAPQRDDDARAG